VYRRACVRAYEAAGRARCCAPVLPGASVCLRTCVFECAAYPTAANHLRAVGLFVFHGSVCVPVPACKCVLVWRQGHSGGGN
jgi:hypothetical protein